MEQERNFATTGRIWDIYFPKLRYWAIGSMAVMVISIIILNIACPLYAEWFMDPYEGYLGLSHTIIAGLSVIAVVILLVFKSGNRVIAATGIIVIDSIAAVWQIWNFWDKAGHISYIEQRALYVLIAETVMMVVCGIMAVRAFWEIIGVDAESVNEE